MSAIVTTNSTIEKPYENCDKILKQLLECVQDCQKRYGGKTELATEFDSCVVGLCLTLEAVLLHGLRTKPLENTSALKHVSDIVTNSLHITSENPSFWPFVRKHLTKHEQERYNVLKHIWTDTGRGRAWIRSSLNERSLERYFHTLLSNSDLLAIHYEDWALLRDQEKSSMLPNMAAGVAAILFAISIDKPELNSGIVARPEALKAKAEPIIEAPVPEKRHKKKNRVARQFISFEEDDSVLSTSVPSSSSSISSDSTSDNQSVRNHKTNLKQIREEKKMETTPSKQNDDDGEHQRKLSIENSGSREKFNYDQPPETLTPITHVEIGELTPVSVEINKNFESPDVSDDILEIPTDISAVLTVVETHNKEELKKKQDRIDMLMKENECLKEQIKKYVSAIQMLRRDDDDDDDDDNDNHENLQKALNDLQIDLQPDYKGEAKLFEKKLVQVAEMHAELMDFNVKLQQNLCQKDLLIERFKNELELLRGPIQNDEFLTNTPGSVNVWIPSAFLTGTGSQSHHVYQIFLRAGNDEWNIYRRYAQFYALHTDLKKLDPTVATFDFPPKKSIGKKDSALVEDRRKRLQLYLRRVLSHWPELAHCNSRFLLEQHLAFFKDLKETDKKGKNVFSPRRNPSDNHYTGL